MSTEIIVSLGDHETTLTNHFTAAALESQYEAYQLAPADIDAFLDLQAIGQAEAMRTGNGHFVKLRSAADLKAHLDAGMAIVGIRHIATGAHVAQAILSDPDHPATINLKGYPLAPGDRIVQSFFIHPDHRFSALSADIRNVSHPASLMFDRLAHLAGTDGGVRMVAKIADDNRPSLKSFERAGYTDMLAIGFDPVRGHAVRYVAAAVKPTVAVAVHYVLPGDRMEITCP